MIAIFLATTIDAANQYYNIGYKKYGWKNVAIKVKEDNLIALNIKLDRLGYETIKDWTQRRF